jgi:hypothetical protein
MTPDNLRDVLAEAFGAHTPVYDYRNGHFTMECEACDFTLYGIDREDAKRRFGEHFANLAAPTVARLIADARAEQVAVDRARVEALADEWESRAANAHSHADARLGLSDADALHAHGDLMQRRAEDLRAALDSEGGA